MIDIIIPVYKGLNETLLCIRSVFQSMEYNQQKSNVIVINDYSPDKNLSLSLVELNKELPFILIHNEKNEGFVATVNRGMQYSKQNDIILLNSDTEVHGNWIDRLYWHAYSQKNISSVTPLSNNANLCSYPQFRKENALPSHYTFSELDTIVGETNYQKHVEIPTSVGFCMYITRTSLNNIGLFDVEHFGIGYGEENDFCMRALKLGYKHLFALDTFVYHKGNVSFQNSSSPRMKAAIKTMSQLHPEYSSLVQTYIEKDPAQKYRMRIDAARLAQSIKPTVLHISHNLGGGIDHHVYDLAKFLSNEINSLLLKKINQHIHIMWINASEVLKFVISEQDSKTFNELINQLNIGAIHFHHFYDIPDYLLELPKQLNIPYFFTAHDFATRCINPSLINEDSFFCELEEVCRKNVQYCKKACAKENFKTYKQRYQDYLKSASLLIAPTQSTATYFHPDLAPSWIVVNHPESIPYTDTIVKRLPLQNEPLNILCLGGLSKHKGADILEEVALLAKEKNLNIRFHLLGFAYKEMIKAPEANLIVYGAYNNNQLIDLINYHNPHIIWFPSTCPETYSYTLSAALCTSIPIFIGNLGAPMERIKNRPFTTIIDYKSDSNEYLKKFIDFLENEQSRQSTSWPAGQAYKNNHNFYKKQYCASVLNKKSINRASTIDMLYKILDEQYPELDKRSKIYQMLIKIYSHPLIYPIAKNIPFDFRKYLKRIFL